jgi:CheY-like chemotaxis protein
MKLDSRPIKSQCIQIVPARILPIFCSRTGFPLLLYARRAYVKTCSKVNSHQISIMPRFRRFVLSEASVSIRVLAATASDVIGDAVKLVLRGSSEITVVGQAVNFGQPDVVLMDLQLPQKDDFTPAFVLSQLRSSRLLALSVVNDADARKLAASYGASTLLDSVRLYSELVPAISKLERSNRPRPSPNRTVSK